MDCFVEDVDMTMLDNYVTRSRENTMCFGGDGLNQAIVLSTLSGYVYFITTLGNDNAGSAIKKYCLGNGIDVNLDCLLEDEKTNMSIVLIDKKMKRHFISTLDGAMRKLSLQNINIDYDKIDYVSFASMFISAEMKINDYEALFHDIKLHGKTLFVDMVKPKNNESAVQCRNLLPMIDYFMPNDIEAMSFTKTFTVETAADELYRLGCPHILIKCGQRGVYLKDSEHACYIPTSYTHNVVDTTGAGDNFAAGFIYSMSIGTPLEKAIKYGNDIAGESIEYIGATTWLKYGFTK